VGNSAAPEPCNESRCSDCEAADPKSPARRKVVMTMERRDDFLIMT
jgi:hypothetical protein